MLQVSPSYHQKFSCQVVSGQDVVLQSVFPAATVGTVRASKWLLPRVYPQVAGQLVWRLKLAGTDGAAMKLGHSVSPQDILHQLRREKMGIKTFS